MKGYFLGSLIIGILVVSAQQKPGFAETMPENIDGYFAYNGSVYARAGGTICGFRKPGHLDIFRRARPARDVNITAISTYKNIGHCPVPRAFFDFGNSGYFSFGNGGFCGFPSPQVQDEYRQRYNAPLVKRISSDPQEFMKYTGRCS
ncbi:MAG: hypothetical protein ACOVQ7_23775 [Limnoraphis robusta]|jgi:hypothetical protein